jgi:hypothetical protein
MTSAAITAELAALDARRAELEQLSADLDNGQLTAKQIERFPVVSQRTHHDACCCSQCIWNDTADALPIPATLADEERAEVGT